jgi:hypothetical protein
VRIEPEEKTFPMRLGAWALEENMTDTRKGIEATR